MFILLGRLSICLTALGSGIDYRGLEIFLGIFQKYAEIATPEEKA